jgi:tetratricopeptide (TPR) repeat protein
VKSNSELQPMQTNQSSPVGLGMGLRPMNFKFWNDWLPGYRIAFQITGALLIILTALLLISIARNPGPTVTWESVQEREVSEKIVHEFQTGPFALQVPAENTIIFEKLLGSDFAFQEWPVYAYFVCMCLGLALLLTVMSCLSRFWFFIGSGMIIFFITGLRLELLMITGVETQIPTITLMILILGVGLVLQYFFETLDFGWRLLVYALVIFGSFGLLAAFAQIPNPVYFMAVSFIPASIIGSAFLVMFTAHEMLAVLILLLSRGLKGTNGFGHFIFLAVIYLINLVMIYFNHQGWFSWDFSVNPIILLTISAALGIWGIMRQQAQMEGFMLPGPLGPLAIMSLAIVAVAASAFFYTTGNDAAIETITSMSLYAHIGFGSIFILYIIANFGAYLKENRPVAQVLYKPKAMPFFTFRFAGTIAMLAFILYNFWLRPINDTKGARDAGMGDYYILSGDINMAEGYYKQSDRTAYHNHKANFILANIEALRGEHTRERQYYLSAAERRPTLQAYMNAVNTLDQSPIKLYAYLDQVKKDFPKSGVVSNALGLVYSKLNQPDSAIYFFNEATKDNLTEATAKINLLGTATRVGMNLNVDSIYALLDDEPGPQANAYALANKNGVVINHTLNSISDTTLNLYTASLISNYLINHRDSLDTAFISVVEKIARKPVNSGYFENVITACAHAAYKNGLVNRAFQLLQEASVYSDNQGRNNNIMALWALDQSAPDVSVDYVKYAVSQEYKDALLTQAIALTEVGRRPEAVILFDSLRSKPELTALTESMIRVLAADKKLIDAFNDLEKYAYCRYRLNYGDSVEFERVLSQINDQDWKARAILDRSKKLFALDEMASAIRTYNLLGGIAMADKVLFDEIQRHELLMLAANGNVEFLKSKLQSGLSVKTSESERVFYNALITHAANDLINAKISLKWLARNNSFFDVGVVAAANVAKQNTNDQLGAYTILSSALHMNPHSVKLLKAYIIESMNLGFDDFAAGAQQTLAEVLPEPLYKKFVSSLR